MNKNLTAKDYIRAAIVILVISLILTAISLKATSGTSDLEDCTSHWVETDTGAFLQYECK